VNRASGTRNVVGGPRSIPGLKTGVTMSDVPAGTGLNKTEMAESRTASKKNAVVFKHAMFESQ